jgi:hypothetical protein
MGTYLAHHWLVSETVVVDKKNTNVGWVFDFLEYPYALTIWKKKNRMTEPLVLGI